MGFFGIGDNEGWDCEDTGDGRQRCRRFKIKQKERYATGTDVTLAVDPQTCETILLETNSMLDRDEQALKKLASQMSSSCKRGLA